MTPYTLHEKEYCCFAMKYLFLQHLRLRKCFTTWKQKTCCVEIQGCKSN